MGWGCMLGVSLSALCGLLCGWWHHNRGHAGEVPRLENGMMTSIRTSKTCDTCGVATGRCYIGVWPGGTGEGSGWERNI